MTNKCMLSATCALPDKHSGKHKKKLELKPIQKLVFGSFIEPEVIIPKKKKVKHRSEAYKERKKLREKLRDRSYRHQSDLAYNYGYWVDESKKIWAFDCSCGGNSGLVDSIAKTMTPAQIKTYYDGGGQYKDLFQPESRFDSN